MLAPDVGGTSYPPYFRAFSRADAKVSLNLRLESIARRGNRVVGAFSTNTAGGGWRRKRT